MTTENIETGLLKGDRKNKGGRPKKVLPTLAQEPRVEASNEESLPVAALKRQRRKQAGYARGSRIPQVPNIPGFRTFWAEDNNPHKAGNIRALTVHDDYEFVNPSEVDFRDADDVLMTGTRVTCESGTNEYGQKMTLYLLKKPLEYFIEDKGAEAIKNLQKVQDVANAKPNVGPEDPTDPKSVNEYMEAMQYGAPGHMNIFNTKN